MRKINHKKSHNFQLFRRALMGVLALFLCVSPVRFVNANLSSFGEFGIGLVQLPDGSLTKGDFLISVYSDQLAMLVQPIKGVNPYPTIHNNPVPGCLSVAQLSLHSGSRFLQEPGSLTFGCTDVPDTAKVYGWINGQWQQMESSKDSQGRFRISFMELTTYAIFLTVPTPPQAGSLSKI